VTATVVGAVIVDHFESPTRIVAARRIGKHAGLWEFPGGKVDTGEGPEEALVREIQEELSATVSVVEELAGPWSISDELELRLFLCVVVSGDLTTGDSHDQMEWIAADDLEDRDWLESDRAAFNTICARLGW